jgi:hypothetical protein
MVKRSAAAAAAKKNSPPKGPAGQGTSPGKASTSGQGSAAGQGSSKSGSHLYNPSGRKYDSLLLFNLGVAGIVDEELDSEDSNDQNVSRMLFWSAPYKEVLSVMPNDFSLARTFDEQTRCTSFEMTFPNEDKPTHFRVFLKIEKGKTSVK